ncbi:MAG TPA: hypothetical protein ENK55_12070 [Actinobacteria bacterium]|nr:hypothetical protein [Actinomycetota bacterium]
MTFVQWADHDAGARYEVVAGGEERHLGRFADVFGIYEGDRLRMELLLDRQTGAPLVSRIYDGDGRIFRSATMVDFRPYASAAKLADAGDGEFEVIVSGDVEVDLPDLAAGYRRTDVYVGPEGVLQAYYTDGLFSFSVFVLDGVRRLEDLAVGRFVDLAGARYLVRVEATELWTLWNDATATYVLVGDLPPDHLEAVLAELPRPERPGFLARLWRRFFG